MGPSIACAHDLSPVRTCSDRSARTQRSRRTESARPRCCFGRSVHDSPEAVGAGGGWVWIRHGVLLTPAGPAGSDGSGRPGHPGRPSRDDLNVAWVVRIVPVVTVTVTVAVNVAVAMAVAMAVRRSAGAARACGRITPVVRPVDGGPEALLQPADLAEDLLAAGHLLLAIWRGGGVGELVDEGAAGVDELGKGRGGPVRDEGLVEGDDVRLGRGRAKGMREGGCIVPGRAVAL